MFNPTTTPYEASDHSILGAVDASAAALDGLTTYWSNCVKRGATPLDVAREVSKWWWTMTERRRPEWSTPNEIIWEAPTLRLRDFTHTAHDDVVPTLVLPPQAGHCSSIVDYSPRQTQMQTIRAAGLTRAYSLEWLGTTQDTKHATIDDYIDAITYAVDLIDRGPVNLIGDCQGGWLAAIYAALHPHHVNTLTIAGAPIDFHVGDPILGDWVDVYAPQFYEALVASGNGVLPGIYQLGGFIAIRPEDEIARQWALLNNIDDREHVERYVHFEDWFKHTHNIPGDFYLWIVEHLFRRNRLVEGTLEIEGEHVDLGSIECPLMLLAGEEDHITPPPQVFAAADHVSSSHIVKRLASGGHLGLFMGRASLREHWPPVLAEVASFSGVEDAHPVVVTDPGHAAPQPMP